MGWATAGPISKEVMSMIKRAPQLQALLDQFTKKNFGTVQTSEACVCCKSVKVQPQDFKNAISKKEFEISGMCQKCQDGVFKK